MLALLLALLLIERAMGCLTEPPSGQLQGCGVDLGKVQKGDEEGKGMTEVEEKVGQGTFTAAKTAKEEGGNDDDDDDDDDDDEEEDDEDDEDDEDEDDEDKDQEPRPAPKITPAPVARNVTQWNVTLASRFQTIKVRHLGGDDRNVLLRLNKSPQVFGPDSPLFHHAFASVPMTMAETLESVLILGGGDGIAADVALSYPSVKSVVLVEIDPDVIKVCSTVPTLVGLNNNVFHRNDSRLQVQIGDAFDYLFAAKRTFDVILYDIEDLEVIQPAFKDENNIPIFYGKVLHKLRKALTPGGVLSDLWVPEEGALSERESLKRRNGPPLATNFELHLALLRKWFRDVKSALLHYSDTIGQHTHLYLSNKELKVRRPHSRPGLQDPVLE